MTIAVKDLHQDLAPRAALLRLNNENARETSPLTSEKFDRIIAVARVATYVEPGAGFLVAFEHTDDYDGGHFRWFRGHLAKFLYVDRVVVANNQRRQGLGRALYEDLFTQARQLGHWHIACEVNALPPNPK